MSLCDRCYAPGYCCRAIHLYQPGDNKEAVWFLDLSMKAQLEMSRPIDKENSFPIPFEIGRVTQSWIDMHTGRSKGIVEFKCPKLADNGRCGAHETRPWLCRDMQAGQGNICVHDGYNAEGTDEIDTVKLIGE